LNTWLKACTDVDSASKSHEEEGEKGVASGAGVEDVEAEAEHGEILQKRLARALKVIKKDKTPLDLRNTK